MYFCNAFHYITLRYHQCGVAWWNLFKPSHPSILNPHVWLATYRKWGNIFVPQVKTSKNILLPTEVLADNFKTLLSFFITANVNLIKWWMQFCFKKKHTFAKNQDKPSDRSPFPSRRTNSLPTDITLWIEMMRWCGIVIAEIRIEIRLKTCTLCRFSGNRLDSYFWQKSPCHDIPYYGRCLLCHQGIQTTKTL